MSNFKISLLLVAFLLLTLFVVNLSVLRIFFSESFYYSNADGSFREFEMHIKGRDYNFIKRCFKSFKEDYPNNPDTVLYINEKKNYLRFWNWYDYKDHPRWHLPYLPMDSLKYNLDGSKK